MKKLKAKMKLLWFEIAHRGFRGGEYAGVTSEVELITSTVSKNWLQQFCLVVSSKWGFTRGILANWAAERGLSLKPCLLKWTKILCACVETCALTCPPQIFREGLVCRYTVPELTLTSKITPRSSYVVSVPTLGPLLHTELPSGSIKAASRPPSVGKTKSLILFHSLNCCNEIWQNWRLFNTVCVFLF